jgi:hypothetical protein
MTSGWGWVEAASWPLGRDEREAVLGDLAEAGAGAWQSLLAVLGLVVRRETELWRSWRPWVAAFGLALPCSFLLMGASLSVTLAMQHVLSSGHGSGPGSAPALLIVQALLLVGWSWTGGFVVGSVSRRTLWVSVASCFLPCLFCLLRFRVESMNRSCLLLFLLPGIWGVREGLRTGGIRLGTALMLAVAVTVLTISTTLYESGQPWREPPQWILTVMLGWPAWYLVKAARKTGREH